MKYLYQKPKICQLETSADISSMGSIDTSKPLYIGRQENNDNYYGGIIDEISIYNRVLTADEIQTLYEQYTP